jgi:hypothetical protein
MLKSLWTAAQLFLARRRQAYIATFRGPLAEIVLEDLAHFCQAHKSTFHADPRIAASLDGRRDVWLRIQQHLQLSPDQLWNLYDGRSADEE